MTRHTTRRRAPRHLAVLAAAVTALGAAPLALAADGDAGSAVMSWGAGRTGQLGNGALADSHTPVAVSGLTRTGVDQISAGGTSSADAFALARTSTGTVTAWGHNSAGQLGAGSDVNSASPQTISGLTRIMDVAAGGRHALAVDTAGRAYAWGDDTYGQLGDSRTGADRTLPDRVTGLPEVKQVAAGCDFSLALAQDGTVYSWGRGVDGQLGTGSRATSSTPQQVKGLADVVQIEAGCQDALALLSDGTVKSWGANGDGQLGNSSTASSAVPVDVDWLEGVNDIEAGASTNFARTADGHVWGWGNNQYGQLLEGAEPFAAGAERADRTAPVEIPRLEGVTHLAVGARSAAAVAGDDVLTWGDNSEGQLGDGTTTAGFDAVRAVRSGAAVKGVAVSLGGNTTYAY